MTPENIKALEEAAVSLEGKQVPCQIGLAEVYFRSGLLSRFKVPRGPLNWARYQSISLIEPWMDESPLFQSIVPPAEPGSLAAVEPGDFIAFKTGHAVHHVAIMLSGGSFVHVFGDHGLKIAPGMPDPYIKRIQRVWRVK